MPTLPFVKVDVFTSKPLQGNQLAVFTNAAGLETEEMQALAREMNLSETTFVIPRSFDEQRQNGIRVRIFTVSEELPFAGHPTLGTAWVLRLTSGASEVWLDLNVGKVPVRFSNDAHGELFGEMQQRDPEFGATHSHEEVARALGLKADDLDRDLPIQTVSTGIAFTIVPFRSLSPLQNLRANWAAISDYVKDKDSKFLYLVCRETVDPDARLHARMIFYNGEDPATGSAAGCCAAWMAAHGTAKSGERILIEQGIEMKRPSRLFVSAENQNHRVTNVRVGGNVVEVARGEVIF
ncbi:MAG TPA: PhzF family phenazine biosynthesis protein [Terriglobales bacterium]|nr:PhzF family phenazine biosynthesis protein [Terriglobales bacterium]